MIGVTADMFQKHTYEPLERVFHIFDEKREEIQSSNVDVVFKFELGEILVQYSFYLSRNQL